MIGLGERSASKRTSEQLDLLRSVFPSNSSSQKCFSSNTAREELDGTSSLSVGREGIMSDKSSAPNKDLLRSRFREYCIV